MNYPPDSMGATSRKEAERWLLEYYDRVADEYDRLYHRDDPIRQGELSAITNTLKDVMLGRRVLEVACGTGFWTAIVAEATEHIVATDISMEMLRVAGKKNLKPDRVDLQVADGYHLGSIPGRFDAGLANFWFSHVPKVRIAEFLDGFHQRLDPGSVVFMVDSVYLPGIGGDLVSLPGIRDTFKKRLLPDGSRHLVLKNYYDQDQLRSILGPRSLDLKINMGKCYWWVSYTINSF